MTDYHDHNDCDETDSPPACCKSCGTPFVEHAGLQGCCAKLQEAMALLHDVALRSDEPCEYDHNRFCQAHYCGEPCLIGRIKEMVR